MFGSSTRADLWRPMILSILGADHRFQQSGGNVWALASNTQIGFESGISFVSIDVETTGLRPRQHRVIEIGLARFRNGRCTDRYSKLINPERRIPEYIRKLTGLTDSDLISAPKFAQIAPEIVDFIGTDTLLGHNVGFDIAFINAELERLRLPVLQGRTIDTVPVSMQVLGRSVRPSLDRVATAVGLNSRQYHRALGDAELTANVAMRLFGMASREGISLETFIRSERLVAANPPGSGQSASSSLDRSHLDGLPRRPGVYLMLDANERVLYVGKAKSIRDRVASYYNQPLGYTRKMDGLVEAIARIDHEETGSELVALLLESQLIRRHQPPYNRMLRNSESYPYIRIDPANPWPNLRLAKHRRPDGARYFGPYRSRSTAKVAIELLSRRFRLRSCGRGFRTAASYGKPCLELDLHRCDGPCVGRANSDEYRHAVRSVIGLLELGQEDLLLGLERDISVAVEELRFEAAQQLRNELEILTRLRDEQRSLASLTMQSPYLIIQHGKRGDELQLLLIIEGRWWCQVALTPTNPAPAVARLGGAWRRYLERGLAAIDHSAVDEANIIARWRALERSGDYVVDIDDTVSPDWERLIATALARPGVITEIGGTGPSPAETPLTL